ncbi:MAG: beta-N-acetylhexosaminidase [Flavobacteriaceae bacterium]
MSIAIHSVNAQHSSIDIIPRPQKIMVGKGVFVMDGQTKIVASKESYGQAMALKQHLEKGIRGSMGIVGPDDKGDIKFELDEGLSEEAYTLRITKKEISIAASSSKGWFYGVESLKQLFPTDINFSMVRADAMELPVLEIDDAPQFRWRAFMLDEGRYFKGKRQVFKLLDEMARLKMNVFHWHLVDDQGWRIEIKKYPLLTEVGSKRPSTQVGPKKWKSKIQSGVPHEGFYTQEDLKEVVRYAEERNITIIPEIEMPGHSSAAIAAYPWLGTLGKEITVPIWFGVSEDVYNVADPKVYGFLTDVLDEVMDIFPSEVIHIGGDEAKYTHWEKSDYIKKYMEENNLESFADLQVDFTNKISQYLEGKGRRMMGWNEILGHNVHEYQSERDAGAEIELSKKAVVHFWKGDIALLSQAAEMGYDIVNSIHSETYLDYSYERIPLKKAYDFNPIPEGLDEKYSDQIQGVGCQMWGEWIPTSGYMDYMVFPRIAAYAEVGWTKPGNKNWEDFNRALKKMELSWKQKGIYFAPASEVGKE